MGRDPFAMWWRLGLAWQRVAMDAAVVVPARLAKLATARPAAAKAEAKRMVVEKLVAFTQAGLAGAVAGPLAATRPIARRARANVNRLKRP